MRKHSDCHERFGEKYIHSALKHSCVQKNEPWMCNLEQKKYQLEIQKGRDSTNLLHVGHSSLEGGFLFAHEVLWHNTTLAIVTGGRANRRK